MFTDKNSKINYGFNRREKNGVVYFTVPAFEPYVNYCFCGEKNSGLVFKATRGADIGAVRDSYKALCNAVGMAYENCVMTNIVHKNNIVEIAEKDRGKGVVSDGCMPECDGLLTATSNIPICSTHADCMPVAFYDKKQNIGCVLHAGWRGIHLGIHKNAVELLTGRYGANTDDILCAVGPCIMECCFEVDKDVFDMFVEVYRNRLIYTEKQGKYNINLAELVIGDVVANGIPEENITFDGRCTACQNSVFTSYRRDKSNAGTMVQIMCLK